MWAKPGVAGWFCGVVVITSALHADGPGFNPQWDHKSSFDAKNEEYQRRWTTLRDYGWINHRWQEVGVLNQTIT